MTTHFKEREGVLEDLKILNAMSTEEKVQALENFILGEETPYAFYLTAYQDVEMDRNEILGDLTTLIEAVSSVNSGSWDFSFTTTIKGGDEESFGIIPHLTIKYDLVEITNTKKFTHIIRDIYVSLELYVSGSGYLYFCDISGKRGKMSVKEAFNGYQHSHLPTIYLSSLNNEENDVKSIRYKSGPRFCLGTSVIADAPHTPLKDRDLLTLFFFNLRSYLEWESIEGVPYKYIEALLYGNKTSKYSYPEYYEQFYLKALDNKLSKGDDLNFNYYVGSDNNFKVVEDEEFVKFFNYLETSDLTKYARSYINHIFCSKVNGVEYVYRGEISKEDVIESEAFKEGLIIGYLKGKPVTLELIENEQTKENENESSKIFIQQKANEYFKKEFNSSLEEKELRRYLFRRVSENKDLERNRRENSILM